MNAKLAGVETRVFCDGVAKTFMELTSAVGMEYDAFVRTTGVEHMEGAKTLWRAMEANGDIYKGVYEGWYSIRDEAFYTESELVKDEETGKMTAPTGAEVEWREKEESYFFKLSAYQEPLLSHIESNPNFILPPSRRNEVVSFLKSGLRDLSISRTSFTWGIPVPNDPEHVMYVWIDALSNYLTQIGYGKSGSESWREKWPPKVHVVGKDILRFHAVYWPAMLMSAGVELPERIFAHGWWTRNGEKISKSLGNVIDPFQLVEEYGKDQTRFFLMAESRFGSDADFDDGRMVEKCNAGLANSYGNLVQRTLSQVYKNCDGKVPKRGELTEADKEILEKCAGSYEQTREFMDMQEIHNYVNHLLGLIRDLNVYIDSQEPWKLKKTDVARMETVLNVLVDAIRRVTIAFQPVMPESTGKILDQMAVPEEDRMMKDIANDDKVVPEGTSIPKPQGVFPRIEPPAKVEA
ncbi:hypothetical protein TrCOL_g1796 [Triparma columacea]|uniref:methionine--tRNA ligase n=1 Tax=Triparma columacea TaxID=722753 RepID=A0A9W7LC61_9STRA|nr:hypothetical protein TrCOL_g1796 [Triparma columacea]